MAGTEGYWTDEVGLDERFGVTFGVYVFKVFVIFILFWSDVAPIVLLGMQFWLRVWSLGCLRCIILLCCGQGNNSRSSFIRIFCGNDDFFR